MPLSSLMIGAFSPAVPSPNCFLRSQPRNSLMLIRSDLRPDAAVIAALYRAAPLYRPVDDVERIRRMYAGSNVVLTAWEGETLVGILRGWADFAYDGYVCDLAVLPGSQNSGAGKALLEKACALGPD